MGTVLDLGSDGIVPNNPVLECRTSNLRALLTIGSHLTEESYTRVIRYECFFCEPGGRGGRGMTHNSFRSLLAKICLFQVFLFVGSTDSQGQQPSTRTPIPTKDSGRLPKVPTVESMVRPEASVERYLSRTPTESAYEKAAYINSSRFRTNDEAEWFNSVAGWTAPEFYTRPLYFEQINFERYETAAPAWTRPARSYVQFLGTIPVLPYKIGANGPTERMYAVGHYPHGQMAPAYSNWGKLSKRGILLQGAATTGLIFIIP